MKLLTLSALVLSTASLISATPAPIAGPQGVVDLVSWGASALSEQLGHQAAVQDDGMKTMASWSWTDCGESDPRGSGEWLLTVGFSGFPCSRSRHGCGVG